LRQTLIDIVSIFFVDSAIKKRQLRIKYSNNLKMNSQLFHGYMVFENGTILSKRLGKPLKARINKNGYLQVNIYINDKRFTKEVHRLIAETFLPNYYGLATVDHKDINKLNNSLYNLEWKDRRGQQINRRINNNNTSGMKGVGFHKVSSTWYAMISKESNKLTRKYFHTKEEAIAQRLIWEREYY
jgi:hypothetical protein